MERVSWKAKLVIALMVLSWASAIILIPPASAANNPIIRLIALFVFIVSLCYVLLILFTLRARIMAQSRAIGRLDGENLDEEGEEKRDGYPDDEDEGSLLSHKNNLASRLMTRLTFDHKLTPYLPALGIMVIMLDLWYNATYNSWSLGETDTTAFLLGGILIVYRFVPDTYAWERDFVMLFSLTLALILIMPLMLTRALQGDPTENVNMYSRVLLGPSLVVMLNLIGIPSSEGPAPPGPGNASYPWIYYTDATGIERSVGISASCAGLYSFSIFVGLFTAFVLVQYRRFSLKIPVLLVIGFLTSYLANVLRMSLIVMASYYYGPGVIVELTHEYTGLLIFLFWLAIFWLFLLWYMREEKKARLLPDVYPEDMTEDDGEEEDYAEVVDTEVIKVNEVHKDKKKTSGKLKKKEGK